MVASATREKDGRARPERTPPRREAGKNLNHYYRAEAWPPPVRLRAAFAATPSATRSGTGSFHAEDVRAGMLSLLDGDRIWCRTGSPDPAERHAEIFSAFRKACDTKPTFTDRMP
jgi:hypothetical protein